MKDKIIQGLKEWMNGNHYSWNHPNYFVGIERKMILGFLHFDCGWNFNEAIDGMNVLIMPALRDKYPDNIVPKLIKLSESFN